ncbi:unnamed protein product [Rhizophagus irregularis]|uniref:Uncharacterized protein n=1 Tax=Rhizophagus irregularis TaxID=588596 RepID=A0A915ZQL3_9GLOM|nr:unnamed protein product [Rhizophagus irregularis]CAB4422138.1 unnamed protein product [Rhizophagus irregularis]CAB4495857.1 unnamed protein product [Rhizophagus irregularis]CAB5215413.1 unnamed protein product [Rhizophagus irregularis]CAB5373551.1 unnamed protein product [Rhizophagus irregularis]
MSVNSLIETSASAPPPIIQQRYGNNNSIIQKPIPIQRNGVLKIRELRPWIRGFDITCIILQHLSRRTLKTQQEVELHSFLVADETAVCTLVIWENGQYYQGGDIVQITLGETRVHEESLELTVNKNFGKIKIIDWDTMYYKEDEEPNLSSYTWIQDEKNPNTYVPMNDEKKLIDLETFRPYERPPQPYVLDSMQSGGFLPNNIKQDFQRERQLRYGSNGGGNEQFMLQYDSRSPRPPLPLSPQTMLQQNDRPRPPQRRNSKFPRRDSWRDQEGRQDRDNGRPRNQDGNKRAGGGGGGRNQPRNRGRDWDRDLDRPSEEGELVNFDFTAGLNGLIRPDNRDPREGIQHKRPRIE